MKSKLLRRIRRDWYIGISNAGETLYPSVCMPKRYKEYIAINKKIQYRFIESNNFINMVIYILEFMGYDKDQIYNMKEKRSSYKNYIKNQEIKESLELQKKRDILFLKLKS